MSIADSASPAAVSPDTVAQTVFPSSLIRNSCVTMSPKS